MRLDLLTRMQKLSDERLYHELYTDPTTGCLNRRAFEMTKLRFLAIVDVDSLKFINDVVGHRAGDELLKVVAHKLVETFGKNNVYRLAGDEFVVTEEQSFFSVKSLSDLQKEIRCFSFGIGASLDGADNHLKEDKRTRELMGTRAKRGMEPPWYIDVRKARFKGLKSA